MIRRQERGAVGAVAGGLLQGGQLDASRIQKRARRNGTPIKGCCPRACRELTCEPLGCVAAMRLRSGRSMRRRAVLRGRARHVAADGARVGTGACHTSKDGRRPPTSQGLLSDEMQSRACACGSRRGEMEGRELKEESVGVSERIGV